MCFVDDKQKGHWRATITHNKVIFYAVNLGGTRVLTVIFPRERSPHLPVLPELRWWMMLGCAAPHFRAICEEIGETSWIKDVVEVHLQRACLFELDSSFITAKQWEAGKPTCLRDARECSQNVRKSDPNCSRLPLYASNILSGLRVGTMACLRYYCSADAKILTLNYHLLYIQQNIYT